MNYIKLAEIPSFLKIKRGEIVFVSSDIVNLGLSCRKHGEKFNPNILIDAFLESIGSEGTLIFPTYNWDFCHGIKFDYRNTRSMTGALSITALQRNEFKRTKHPIYSFAVAGKYQDEICSMENISSFGNDSPFAFMEKHNVKNVIIDLLISQCFTFQHYLEQKIGVPYRYEKVFTAEYVDDDGKESLRSYSMYVRNLDLDVINDLEAMGKDLEAIGALNKILINKIPYLLVNMGECYPLYKNDIENNKCRKIVKFIGQ